MMEDIPDADDSYVKEMLETFAIGLNHEEQKLLTLLLGGYTRAEIAELMEISVKQLFLAVLIITCEKPIEKAA